MTFPHDIDEFAARFAACTLPKEEWTHQAHLAIGLWHVHRHGPDDALSRLRDGIRRLNDVHGTINSETGGYHETITRAYVLLLAQFNELQPPNVPVQARVNDLLGTKFVERTFLFDFYSRDLLKSSQARKAWVAPDLGPLRLNEKPMS